jgi:hypothetical protein
MPVHGLGSPNESSSATTNGSGVSVAVQSPKNQDKRATPPAAGAASPSAANAASPKPSSAYGAFQAPAVVVAGGTGRDPGIVAAGSFAEGPGVVVAKPVPVTGKPDELSHHRSVMYKLLADPVESKANRSVFYYSVVNVLLLMTGHRMTDDPVSLLVEDKRPLNQEIENAVERLIADWRQTHPNVQAPELEAAAAHLRQAAADFRLNTRIAYLSMTFSGADRAKQEQTRIDKVIGWIMPHDNEGGIEKHQLGNTIFGRLLAVLKGLAPAATIYWMARFYDAAVAAEKSGAPLYAESKTAVKELADRLKGARESDDLRKAWLLIIFFTKENPTDPHPAGA